MVREAKITQYLLNEAHPANQGKAAFFQSLGYSSSSWKALAEALIAHAHVNEVAQVVETVHGTKYVVEGALITPDGRAADVRSIWIIDAQHAYPVLVTAYRLRRK